MSARESLHQRTRSALGGLGVHPRRRLGQNFLADPRVAARIVEAAAVNGRVVVEIGAGMGALSESLAAAAGELFLVELDARLAAALRERFAGVAHVQVVAADALEVDYGRLLDGRRRAVVVANLPYSVGSQILLRLITFRAAVERLVLMLQSEVAARLVARPGTKTYGALTLWTALYGRSELLFRVPAGAFVPRPKVESAVVSIALQCEPRATLLDEAHFRTIVRAAFGQRRKTLRAALRGLADPADFERAGIDAGRRGETLSLDEFARLSDTIHAARAPL